MKQRIEQEMELLRTRYPKAGWHPNSASENDGGWILIPDYNLPMDIWDKNQADICFEVKAGYPGVAPYSFYVRDGVKLKGGGDPQSYSVVLEAPFGGSWGKFSWSHADSWKPTGDLSSGSNLLNFVSSFNDRLREAS